MEGAYSGPWERDSAQILVLASRNGKYAITLAARGGVVVKALRFPMVSLEFFSDIILLVAL